MNDTASMGAVFRRCALQVNPHHYSGAFRGREAEGDPRSHAETIVAKAVEIGISALAITDHNNIGGVAAFRDAAKSRDIAIFPGFEISSSEGIHILCIYPLDTDDESLNRFLGELGIRETKSSSTLSDNGLEDLLAKVQRQGGITIAAHVTNDKGLFKVLSGQARINAWRDPNLLAIQIPGPVGGLPQHIRHIVENTNPDYRRDHPVDEKLAMAVINAKDVLKSEDLDHGSATCWIKMSEVSLEGLRQAFLDPGSRIRLNSDPEPEGHAELVSLAWKGGFLDGVEVPLNPNLNVLVGGRGAGKSTIIESLRYALDLEPVGEEARKAHQGIVGRVLRSGTQISLRMRSYRPTSVEYTIERTVPNPPVVRDGSGQVSNLRPMEVLPRIEVYGQHEISELTRSAEKLTRLLDRFVERDLSLARRKADIRRDLEKTRRSILDVHLELDQIEEQLATLPSLEETLKRFQEAKLEEKLRERSSFVREERVLHSVSERLKPFHDCLEILRQEIPIDQAFLSAESLKDLPSKVVFSDVDYVLTRLNRDMGDLARRFGEALRRADEGIAEIRARWGERKENVQQKYEEILRDLERSAVDAEEFIRIRGEIENLRPLRERQELLQRGKTEHMERRRALRAEWEDLKAEEFRLLDRAAEKVGKTLFGRVQVEIAASGNRDPLSNLLRNEVGGRLSEAIGILTETENLSLPELADKCREGADAVRKAYGVPETQARRLAEAPPEVLMQIEELELPPTTSIQLNTAPIGTPPSWQALEDLSTGQKATAVLLLLLLESDAPLIVDQPEDDLDNRFITEGVVPRMREEKRRRQFVFSTHNANIPVLGDAELILGLTAKGGADEGKASIEPKHMGSIDTRPVRDLVEDILEGGKDAFETRRLKYGF